MTGTKKCTLKQKSLEPKLAARCCCPLFVPFWCCRGDIYLRRVRQINEERRQSEEFESELQISGRNI